MSQLLHPDIICATATHIISIDFSESTAAAPVSRIELISGGKKTPQDLD
jgi:hypothetical protein